MDNYILNIIRSVILFCFFLKDRITRFYLLTFVIWKKLQTLLMNYV